MAEIILFPTHEDYCKECIYDDLERGICKNPKYNENMFKAICKDKYCKYKVINKRNNRYD